MRTLVIVIVGGLVIASETLEALTPRAAPSPKAHCKTEIREWAGSQEGQGRCAGSPGSWSCFQHVVERCTEPSGRLTQREFRHWTGTCAVTADACQIPNGRALEATAATTSLATPRRVSEALTVVTSITTPQAPTGDEGWVCDEVVLEKTSRLDVEHGICGRTGDTAAKAPWACFQEVERRCRQRYSGKVRASKEKRFQGCFESFADCR